ncbi:protein phosphatase [Clostridium acetobutylicum]|nr:protein phosphatase [Clostridium acetobutylicum]NYC94432.1 protein phosphatase [Clostridium acetobutylicum]
MDSLEEIILKKVKGNNMKMVGMLSDIGTVRKLNEDYVGYYENDDIRFYVVADGMGGHNAGEVASKLAVDSTVKYIKEINNINLYELGDVLSSAIKFANEQIYRKSKASDGLSGMGTTITACLIKDKDAVVANVGDSSCYFIKRDDIIKITKDHSLVQQLVDNGTITEKEALSHPNKNIITRALGTGEDVDVDIFDVTLNDVSKGILATDGLTNVVDTREIYNIVLENDNMVACQKLIELSKDKGSRDNISVIVFEGECKDDRNCAK